MTSSESVRDRIARVLAKSIDPDRMPWSYDYRRADAVLAEFPMLGGVTDSMVEAGARGLTRHYFAEEGIYNPCEAKVTEHTVEPIRDSARAVLEAVYGKAEQ